MQKIGILFILVIMSLLVRSQDSTDYTLNNIRKYATHIDESYLTISNNGITDQHEAMVQQAENIKGYIDSMEDEMQYLPDNYYYRLSPLVSSYHTDVNEFEKLLSNEDFPNKDAYLARAFNSLQQRQSEFRKTLDSAYKTALPLQHLTEDNPGNDIVKKDSQPVIEQHSATSDTVAANDSNTVLVEAVNPNEITTSNNSLLLDTIHQAQQQIEQLIGSIHLQMNDNNFSKMGVYANGISKASLKISDLALLLKTDQKESLYILATGLKNLSEKLRQLALHGTAAQSEMQECIDEIAIKFSTLSTGINLVQ